MKIKKVLFKNLIIQNILALLAALFILFVRITSSIKIINENIPQKYWSNQEPFILAFWHSQLMMIGCSWAIKKKINVLASGHSDGRFGAKIGKYFRLNNFPTSKSNKISNFRPIFNLLKSKEYIGITPDGPRGPKEKATEGIIKIAKTSGVPIIPIGFWSSRNRKLNSWDSFLITLPFSKCSFVWGKPIEIPKKITNKEIIEVQSLLEKEINKCIFKAKLNCK
mgnify:FL=1